MSSARWLSVMVLLIIGMAIVTYFYSLQVDAGQSDETGTVSNLRKLLFPAGQSA